jgi:hypothetical protein
MRRRELPALLALLGAAAHAGAAEPDVVRQVGRVVFRVDTRYAFPGGVLLARVSSSTRLGGVSVLLAGRRVPLMPAGGVLRALVPVPLTLAPGPLTLGFEVSARRGRQRIPVEIQTVPRAYPPRVVSLPPAKLALVASRQTLFDGRRVLQALRETALQVVHLGPLRPPVDGVAGQGFGCPTSYPGADRPVESLEDALFGEQHHGLDYEVPVGTAVRAPGAGRVLLATWLAGTGWTILIDHGQGMVSGLLHLSAVTVRAGDEVQAGAVVGRSGEHGLVAGPLVQWNTYVHGVAVDPEILTRGFPE